MATMTLQVGDFDFWYPEEDHGPPLPHSLWLWELWGCYEHYNCITYVDPLTPKGQKDRVVHETLDELRSEIDGTSIRGWKHAENCECWRHWLLGDMAHKDYPQTYEPIISQHKKGPRRNG